MTHDVAEDVDIYSDLSTVNYGDTLKQLESTNSQLLQQIEKLKLELSSVVKEKEGLEKKCQIFSYNLSSLLKTAKAEIQRKEQTIADLRSEINNVLFRRNKMGGKWSNRQCQDAVEPSASKDRLKGDYKDDSSSLPRRRIGDDSSLSRRRIDEDSSLSRRRIDSDTSLSRRRLDDDSSLPRKRKDSNSVSKSKLLLSSVDKSSSKSNKCLTLSSSEDKVLGNSDKSKYLDEDKRHKGQVLEDLKEDLRNDIIRRRHERSEVNTTYSRSKGHNVPKILKETLSSSLKDEVITIQVDPVDCITSDKPSESIINVAPDNLEKSNCNVDSASADKLTDLDKKETKSCLSKPFTPSVLTEYSRRMLKRMQCTSTDNANKPQVCDSVVNNLIESFTDKSCLPSQNGIASFSEPLTTESKNLEGELKESAVYKEKNDKDVDIVKSDLIVLPDNFKAISSNADFLGLSVSTDLSVRFKDRSKINKPNMIKVVDNVSSNSKDKSVDKTLINIPEKDSNNTNKINANTEKELGKIDDCLAVQSSGVYPPHHIEKDVLDRKSEVGNKDVIHNNTIHIETDAVSGKSGNEVLNSPCIDSILSHSDSLQDILNLNGEKSKVNNITFELFSLESIDKFAVSPKKQFPSEAIQESNKNETVSNVIICETGISKVLNVKENLLENELKKQSDDASNLEKVDADTKICSKEINPKDPLVVNGSSIMSAVAISKEGIVQVNDETVESYASRVVQIKKKNKNGIQPIIKPVSSLWSNTLVTSCKINDTIVPKTIPDEPVNSNDKMCSKSDIVQSLFGSPVKWADSDSIDFIPPTLDKDPSVFEDSRSVADELKINIKSSVEVTSKIISNPFKDNIIGRANGFLSSTTKHDSISLSTIKDSKVESNLSNIKIQNMRYEDSLLGQFDDTLQFVSALSKHKKTVSPIGTPEKLDLEKSNSSNSKPFSSLSITQKADFKLVSPNEKPINILTPRKTPRVVSPKKANLSSSPNSADLKSSRISCIDDKAIESVCNLVSSIKDTHRETYLVISKKPKVQRNSPKKLDSKECPKIKSPISDKLSPNKSPLKSGTVPPRNKSDKVCPFKKNTSLKVTSKKKTSMKLVNTPISTPDMCPIKSPLVTHETISKAMPDLISLQDPKLPEIISLPQKKTLEINPLPHKKQVSCTKLIDSLPMIPKSNSCTKVRMSYELKKPSRMCSRKTNQDRINRIFDKKTSDEGVNVNNNPQPLKTTNNDSTINATPVVNISSLKSNKDCVISLEKYLDIDDDVLPKILVTEVSDVQKTEATLQDHVKANDSHLLTTSFSVELNENVFLGKNVPNNYLQVPSTLDLSENKAVKKVFSDEIIKIDQTNNIISSVSSSVVNSSVIDKNILEEIENCLDNFKSIDKHDKTKSKDRDLVNSKKIIINQNNEATSINNLIKSTHSHSLPMNEKSKNSRKSPSLKNLELSGSSKVFKLKDDQFDGHSKCHRIPEDSDRHYNKRFYKFPNDLSYRRKLSKRYSCYHRREPSSRRSRSPSLGRKIRHRRHRFSRRHNSPCESLRNGVQKDYDNKQFYVMGRKSSSKSWSSSRIEAVSISPIPKVDPTSSKSTYDRINGITCNNLKWKLVKIDNIPDLPKRKKTVPDISSLQSPVCTSHSPSPLNSSASPKIIAKRKALNFASSEVKTESFSSSPNKSGSANNIFSQKSLVFKTPPLKVTEQSLFNMKVESTSNLNSKEVENRLHPHSKQCTLEEEGNTRNIISQCLSNKKQTGEKTSLNGNSNAIKTNTITYRVPSFLKKSSGEEMKTVNVSKMQEKYLGLYTSPPRSGVKKQLPLKQSKKSNASPCLNDDSLSSSDSSFTSDESWVPKKKRKR